MKLKNLFFGSLACLAFAACSNDDEVQNPQNELKDGYIAFAISMPGTNSTRAFDETSDLDDGSENEYAVEDATVLIFNGTEETSSLVMKQALNAVFEDETSSNQITSQSRKLTAQVSGVAANYGLLVVLNANGALDAVSIGQTFEEISEQLLDENDENTRKEGFLMTNAPLSNTEESTSYAGTVKRLVNITNVYPTLAEALIADPDEVFVERAHVKVTMSEAISNNLSNENTNLKYSVKGWAISNKNTKSYLVRKTTTALMTPWAKLVSNVSGAVTDKGRFIGTTEVMTGYGYRTYFAEDPNYNTPVVAGDLADATTLSEQFGTDHPQYCYENTFSVAQMFDRNTTHVVISAQLIDKTTDTPADFYIINGNKDLVIYNETDENLQKYVYNAVKDQVTTAVLSAGLNGTLTETDFIVTYETVDASADLEITAIALTDAGKTKYNSTTEADAVNTAITNKLTEINNSVSIAKYDNGMSYYAARIKHFGDDVTPWSSEGKTTAYPDDPAGSAEANWLGRYGVLRNNWYDLSVDGILNIGEPTIEAINGKEDDGEDTDDEIDSYVVLRINILSWAKRSQNVIL